MRHRGQGQRDRGKPPAGAACVRAARPIGLLPVLSLALCLPAPAPAVAQAFANEMTCAQAIAHYEATGTIFVMANERFAVPLRGGTPIGRAATVQCSDQGQIPRPVSVLTRDVRRCVIAVRC